MKTFNTSATPIALAITALAMSACGGQLGPEDLDRLEVQAGNSQSAPAGSAVPVKPAVKTVDKGGKPIPGVTVTFEVSAGGGSVSGGTATSNSQGIATVGDWVLGSLLGENVLSATAPGAAAAVTFTATSVVGPPALFEIVEGADQTGTAGRPLPVRPRLKLTDQVGNPINGVEVGLTVTNGGGTLAQASSFSNPDGEFLVIGWTLGVVPGSNMVTAAAGDASGVVTATGVAGPVTLVAVAGDSQMGTVSGPLPVAPRVQVLDAQGLGVVGANVAFGVQTGGGNLGADTVSTDMNGFAEAQWTLGTVAGENSIFAQVADLAVLQFFATGVADAPAMLTPFTGDDQIAAVNQTLSIAPSVLVGDQFNNPVPGVQVNFAVTGGGGAITGDSTVSDSNGVATLGSWTMGPAAGQNAVQATSPGLPPLTLIANALSSVFDIEIVRLGGGGPNVATAIDNAVTRWTSLIIGDLPDVSFAASPVDSAFCGAAHPPINDVVDDVRIFMRIESIDGPGSVLGSAGPCLVRDNAGLTVVGVMRFDDADLDNLAAQGLLDIVIMHEMGHVLGVGSLWRDLLINPSLPNNQGADTHFGGPRAIAAFDSIGGAGFAASKVPVENTQGGQGTRDSHWRESVFVNEFMTGFINNGFNPISLVTVESLGDIGYLVNSSGADPFTIPNPSPPAGVAAESGGVLMLNDVRRGPVYAVDENGRIVVTLVAPEAGN